MVRTRPIPRLAAVSPATTAAPRSGGGVEAGMNVSPGTPLALTAFTATSLPAPSQQLRNVPGARPDGIPLPWSEHFCALQGKRTSADVGPAQDPASVRGEPVGFGHGVPRNRTRFSRPGGGGRPLQLAAGPSALRAGPDELPGVPGGRRRRHRDPGGTPRRGGRSQRRLPAPSGGPGRAHVHVPGPLGSPGGGARIL